MLLVGGLKKGKMFNKDFVVAIKVDGKVMREFGNEVKIPFGKTYSIFLKNLSSRDAVANVKVDGILATPRGIIVRANSSTELRGYIRGEILMNAFKFIRMTDEIEEYRGCKEDDGIIAVDYRFVVNPVRITSVPPNKWVYVKTTTWQDPCINVYRPPTYTSGYHGGGTYTSCSFQNHSDVQNNNFYSEKNDNGITVDGYEINEHVQESSIGYLEDEIHTISLRLSGYENEQKIDKPIAVQDKKTCKTCGQKNSYSYLYCPRCGTHL